jgi:hypothetical protein
MQTCQVVRYKGQQVATQPKDQVDVFVVSYQVLEEYKLLIMRMNNDLHVIPLAKKTLEFLCDVEVVMGLKCIMPMLEIVHELIEFAQSRVSFVCNFVGVGSKDVLCGFVHSIM